MASPLTWVLLAAGTGAFALGVTGPTTAPAPAKKSKIEFNRDIRPIISKCLACHGHDKEAVMAGLKLDVRESAITKLTTGHTAIVPGHPEQSELISRVMSKDPDVVMPPPFTNKILSAQEKELLNQWIAEGAEYKDHWGFVKPERPPVPTVKETKWPRNPIDNFILAKIEEAGIKPSPETDKRTLIRRVTLDLTGLPPTPDEVKSFVEDSSPNAYEKVVDRLLKSSRYGERMAMDWMDYARYADSNGYQADYERYQWRWRDWVINAFNDNMPYDKFTVDQIAGDLLPNATLDEKLATGFNRNHRINTEGGVIPEEWRVETVIDRVETTTTVWLGLTAGCARCHDHKYDPISQKEFYSLYSYFNNVPESGSGVEQPVNHPPIMKAPTSAQGLKMKALEVSLSKLDREMGKVAATNVSKAQNWVLAEEKPPEAGRVLRATFPSADAKASGDVKYAAGRVSGSVFTNDKGYLDLGQVGDFDGNKPFTYSLWINPSMENGSPISKLDSEHGYRGWDLFMQGRRPAFHLIDNWPAKGMKVISKTMVPLNEWSQITVTTDGTGKAAGARIYVNGVKTDLEVENDTFMGSAHTDVTAKVGRRTNESFYTGQVDEVSFYDRAVTEAEAKALAMVNPAASLLAVPLIKRTPEQRLKIAELWSAANDKAYKTLLAQKNIASHNESTLDGQISTVMVMEEMAKPREAHVLVRGQYDHPGDKVEAAIPAVFKSSIPAGAPNNRLGLAEWIVSPENPLTARVTVNRMWERLFGVGIVETSEDFGTRASFPTHPELLDWMATELLAKKWDLKSMWKELVMSATYRQSSDITPELEKVDPTNSLVARGARLRLNGEVIRDQAMYAGGLLKEIIGGPSVRPYQPDGVWDSMSVYGNLRNYKHDLGTNLYRRSLYTIWKRTAAPPAMTVFDVPTRETCRVKRTRTDTPLQALALLNDETYLESARAIGERLIREGGPDSGSRIKFAYQILFSRDPSSAELSLLKKSVGRRIEAYKQDVKSADALLEIGDLPQDPSIDKSELAAYTFLASTLLNTDEMVTRE